MTIEDDLKDLKEDIAKVEEMLAIAQKHYDDHRHLWDDAVAWEMQARIDTATFDLELKKLKVSVIEGIIP